MGDTVVYSHFVNSARIEMRQKTMVVTVRKNKLSPTLICLGGKNGLFMKVFTPPTTLISYPSKKYGTQDAWDSRSWGHEVSHHPGEQSQERRCGQPGHGDWNLQLVEDVCPLSLVIFYNFIKVSLCSAFVIWNKIIWKPGNQNKWRLFFEQLVKALKTSTSEQPLEHLWKPFRWLTYSNPPNAAPRAGKGRRWQLCPYTHLYTVLHMLIWVFIIFL